MKLYLIVRTGEDDEASFDAKHAHVIRAESPSRVRELAAQVAGDEGSEVWRRTLTAKVSEIKMEGPEAIILTKDWPG